MSHRWRQCSVSITNEFASIAYQPPAAPPSRCRTCPVRRPRCAWRTQRAEQQATNSARPPSPCSAVTARRCCAPTAAHELELPRPDPDRVRRPKLEPRALRGEALGVVGLELRPLLEERQPTRHATMALTPSAPHAIHEPHHANARRGRRGAGRDHDQSSRRCRPRGSATRRARTRRRRRRPRSRRTRPRCGRACGCTAARPRVSSTRISAAGIRNGP